MKINFHQFRNTLKGRLTFWYLTTIGLIILVILSAISGLFWLIIRDQIDHHVHIAVSEAKQIVENYRGQERDGLIKNLVSGKGMTVVVLSPDGSPLLETNSPDVAIGTEHQLQKILTTNRLFESSPTHFSTGSIRFAAVPAQVSAGKGIVAVGYSTSILYDAFFAMIGIVIGVSAMLVLIVAFLGHRWLSQQLSPLELIANQAKNIGSSLSDRIYIDPPTKELDTIQNALNSMLSKIENIFLNEREFFSDAAHTLKTPLAVIRSQIENIKQNPRMKNDLLLSLDTANNTIQDLLFLSRVATQQHDLKSLSLSKLLIDLADLTGTLGEEKRLEIITDIPKDITLKTNPQLLTKALTNILHNAVIYNKPHGKIFITLKSLRHCEPALAGVAISYNQIEIIIKDTGIGIPKKDLPHIFDRFYRGQSGSKGSGLGLAITNSVITSLRGTITATSRLHHGTTIILTLPTTPSLRVS